MNYPLISEYIQAIKLSEENFDKLTNLCPVLDVDGNPIMSSGNFAVVFKMLDKQTGKFYAVKCFLREQEGREESYKLIASELEYISSAFLTPIKYFEKELFVDTTQGNDTEFPVLLMDWVEGLTLYKYIRNNIHDQYKLALIAYQFCRMGSWLLSQEFAHGDLKPDNIIVREDGQLVLVDYDGMFVPAMRGQKSRELGSVDYRHPLRTENVFNCSIDDFSIASIALSLKAISLKPELLNDFGTEDRLLFCVKDYQNIGESECLKAIQLLSNDVELAQLLGLFYIAYARNELSNVSFKLFNIAKPEYSPVIVLEVQLFTKVTKEDLDNAVIDEYGVKYSRDGLRLLEAPKDIEEYKIKDGTNIICDDAFIECEYLKKITIPYSIQKIGNSAFYCCLSLKEIYISSFVVSIGNSAFNKCKSLKMYLSNARYSIIDDSLLIDCENNTIISYFGCVKNIVVPSFIVNIGKGAFYACDFIEKIFFSDSVVNIGDEAFYCCTSLNEVNLSININKIGNYSFYECESLESITLPTSLINIGEYAFAGCRILRSINLPTSLKSIGRYAFGDCKTLKNIVLPASILHIGNYAFNGCDFLRLYSSSPLYVIIEGNILIDNESKTIISCFGNIKK